LDEGEEAAVLIRREGGRGRRRGGRRAEEGMGGHYQGHKRGT